MAEKITEQINKQPVLNIGMIGHIDHGKTTLLHRLTGKWTDTHSEELKRGITIKLGYADSLIRKCSCGYTIKEKCEKCGKNTQPIRHISFVDAPGHEMLMATMLSGAAIIDAAILVIAVNEKCPQPQTKEHLAALQVKDIKQIIIVQNKIDLVSKEEAEKNYQEIKEFVKGTIAENAEIIPMSAQQGINIDVLLERICSMEIPERNTKEKPVFFIARSFDVNKPGVAAEQLSGGVLGGILKQGILHVGDEIEIKPGIAEKKHNSTIYKTIKTKILALQSGKNKLEEAFPSGSLAIQTELDPFLTKADSLAGCVASSVGFLPEISNTVKLKTKLFTKVVGTKKELEVEKIKQNEPLLLSINTTITVGVVTSIRGNEKEQEIQIALKIPVVALKGTKGGIARNLQGHWRLIGWGEIL